VLSTPRAFWIHIAIVDDVPARGSERAMPALPALPARSGAESQRLARGLGCDMSSQWGVGQSPILKHNVVPSEVNFELSVRILDLFAANVEHFENDKGL